MKTYQALMAESDYYGKKVDQIQDAAARARASDILLELFNFHAQPSDERRQALLAELKALLP